MNSLTQSKNTTILPVLIALTLTCFAVSPTARAVCQQGCLANGATALGDNALINNTGSFNTAIGAAALVNNTTGLGNTAVGWGALGFNITGGSNTAVGDSALAANTGGSNTAVGSVAMVENTTGNFNTATGTAAMQANHTGSNNAAYGFDALQINNTGSNNTAVGSFALRQNKRGDSNIAVGFQAGRALTTGNNNIYIGNLGGGSGESSSIRIGTTGTQNATFIAGISGATVPTGVAVIVDADGHLGTTTSSARYKEAIKPINKASEAILALRPVTFRYKHELDPDGIPQFGLVAEEVEKVNPDLVARDEQGKPYTVRYEAVNAMLLNEFLKEHRTVQEQKATIAQLKSAVAKQEATAVHQQKQIEALTAGLQKVSAQVELSKPAPQTVLNNQ